MTLLVDSAVVEPMTRGLLGVVDVEAGATDEQLAVLRAVVTHLWERDDLDLSALTPLEPSEVASAIGGEADRRRFKELMVTLELCRHPPSEAQVERVESYARALGVSGPALEIIRSWIDEGTKRATADP